MKRVLTLLLAAAMVLALCACSAPGNLPERVETSDTTAQENLPDTTETPPETPASTEPPVPEDALFQGFSEEEETEASGHLHEKEYFTELSEDEYNQALSKMIVKEPDAVLSARYFLNAGFYVDGAPKIMYGIALPTDEFGVYIFMDLFTEEEMFKYYTPNADGLSATYTFEPNKDILLLTRVDMDPIHPYFVGKDIQLSYVDLRSQCTNFMREAGYLDVLNSSKLDYAISMMPETTEVDWLISDYLYSYLNLIPEPMQVTSEDLELAKEQQEG